MFVLNFTVVRQMHQKGSLAASQHLAQVGSLSASRLKQGNTLRTKSPPCLCKIWHLISIFKNSNVSLIPNNHLKRSVFIKILSRESRDRNRNGDRLTPTQLSQDNPCYQRTALILRKLQLQFRHETKNYDSQHPQFLILQVRLGRRYRAQLGAPTLVLLEGGTGRLITRNGCDRLKEDPTGVLFPWTPRALTEVLREAGPYLPGGKRAASKLSAADSRVRYSELDGLVKGIYFSAHWVSTVDRTCLY